MFRSSQNTLHYLAFLGRADESVVEALIGKAESMGVEADLMEYGGLEIADADGVLGNIVANVVCLSIDTGLYACPCHPHGEGMGMMVSTVEALFQS